MNLGFGEMFFIFILALIIFGPKKLPEIGRQIGRALADFKRYSNDFKYQLETEVRQWEIEETLRKEKESLKETILPEGTIPTDVLKLDSEPNQSAMAESPVESVSSEPSYPADPPVSPSKETNA